MHLSMTKMHFNDFRGCALFYDQLIKLCDLRGIKPTPLVKSLGMSTGSINNWKNGAVPNGEALMRFSEFFDVSIDYLVYGKISQSVSEEDTEWLSLIHKLPKEAQTEFKAEMKGYLKAYHKSISKTHDLKQAK